MQRIAFSPDGCRLSFKDIELRDGRRDADANIAIRKYTKNTLTGRVGDLKEVLGLDAVMLGLFLPEDNLHAPNESFHLGVMKRGIETSEKVLASLAGVKL